jgi:hypothetical protein
MSNENIETPEVIEGIDVVELEPECGSEGIGLAKIALASLLVVGGAAALRYKFRSKIEERQVEKLRKKGYTIQEPVEVLDKDDFDEDDVEDSEK